MRRGATPTITLTVIDFDLSVATHIWVTFDQNGTQVVREWKRYLAEDENNDGIMVVGQTITVKLSQEETLGFNEGNVKVQVKMKQDDFDETTTRDTVTVSVVERLKVEEGINEEIM